MMNFEQKKQALLEIGVNKHALAFIIDNVMREEAKDINLSMDSQLSFLYTRKIYVDEITKRLKRYQLMR